MNERVSSSSTQTAAIHKPSNGAYSASVDGILRRVRGERSSIEPALVRVAFHVTVLCAGLVFWVSHYPAMADLPQHAAQVVALRELLEGSSAWADVLRINLFTPYLIGYALALPLSYVLSIADVLKLLLSLAFYGFVGAHVLLRRHFSADPRLDWLSIPGFFGFA